jgi:hypothetical protein
MARCRINYKNDEGRGDDRCALMRLTEERQGSTSRIGAAESSDPPWAST